MANVVSETKLAQDFDEREVLREIELLERAEAARLRECGMEGYVPNRKQLEAHSSLARTILYIGGNRAGKCLTADTVIETPDGEFTVGELYGRRERFRVWAWDGDKRVVGWAGVPFKKGEHECYRLKTDTGVIEAADRHRILNRTGLWNYVSDLYEVWHSGSLSSEFPLKNISVYGQHQGVSSFLPRSSLGISRLVHGEDDPSFFEKALDYRDDYLGDFRRYDEPPLSGQENVQFFSPLQACVVRHDSILSCSDDLGSRYNGILKRSLSRPSTLDVRPQPEDLASVDLSQTSYTTSQSFEEQPHKFSQSSHASVSELQSVFLTSRCSYALPLGVNRIISFEPIGTKEVFDFEVERFHNYFAGGMVHHNSTFGAMELCFHLTRNYPDWYPEEKRFKGPIKAAISATEFPVVGRVIEPKINTFLPRDYFKVKRSNQGYVSKIICKDGSTVDILTLEMKNDAYESADWDFIWCDEPQSKTKYQAMRRGLVDRRGLMVITFTPLTEPWMKEELVDKADGKAIQAVTVDIRDNLSDVNGAEILPKQAVDEFEKSLPEEVLETRARGKFFHLKGIVYKEFSLDAHVSNFSYDYKLQYPVICVLDPADRKPHHLIWAFIDPIDDIFVHYELVTHCELPQLARKIKTVEEHWHYKVAKRLIDPNFGRKPYTSGGNVTVMSELARHGARFTEANDDKATGHMLVRDYLHYRIRDPITIMNKPKIKFNREGVPRTIHSIQNLQFGDWKGTTGDDRDPKEDQKPLDDDGADCIRYLCISRPKYEFFARREKIIQQSELTAPVY